MRLFSFIVLMAMIVGCKRSWTEKDKSEFVSGCLSRSVPEMGETKAKAYCSCLIEKIVTAYPNANDAKYIRYDSSVQRLAKDCLKQN